MTEDAMFIAIFNYIEHLFGKIKPQKLFFMAIDGVAPRAKMNQQRARRFRTAFDAEVARDKALREGLEMPKESPFDSNCITPGTEFMAKLTRQLKYFISKKITEDADWQNVEVVLSGHEVPGEGEHKIMEYIRQAKAQPGYEANVRHCLYGLDADLIMLGLLSHDPHFCLLREEVTFGRQNQKKSKELEHQNFYLMHLCVVREYLELEFQQLKHPGALSFAFDLERVIDDFILMAFFVGNDFLPHLPHLHINEGALSLMFDTYKTILPKVTGYINEKGRINLDRLQVLLDELSKVEFRFFEAENSDANWLRSKQRLETEEMGRDNKRGKLVMSSGQREIFKLIKVWVNKSTGALDRQPYDLPVAPSAKDRDFVQTLVEALHLEWRTVQTSDGDRHMQLTFPMSAAAEDESDEEEEDEEAQSAIFRVMRRYETAKIVDVTADQAQHELERKYQEKFRAWKDKHYTSKLSWGLENEAELRNLTENYVQGLQWVLYYYYRGVASWPWFFKYHYSPMISDVKKGLGADMNFVLGQPFHPYQQLMGVLPDRSKSIVPEAYHDLMTNKDSPIIDFYPRDFELDMNGKKMEWEAVVKIPFIDEKRLLSAMSTKDHLLTENEQKRNEFGVSLKFAYSSTSNYTHPSSLPGVFGDIPNCHCVENIFELPTMDGLSVYVGLVDGVKIGKAALAGFPSLQTIPFAGALGYHGVSVFQQDSRNQSMVITLLDAEVENKASRAQKKIGKIVHVGYPFLQEAKIIRVSDELFEYKLDGNEVISLPHDNFAASEWRKKAERIETTYSKRLGVITGTVESLVHVDMLKGLTKTAEGATIKEYGEILGIETDYASQTIVDEVISADQRFIEKAALPLYEEFPIGSRAFFLGAMAYGRPLEVVSHTRDKLGIYVATLKGQDQSWGRGIVMDAERNTPYTPSFAVAKKLGLNPLALSKITSSFTVNTAALRLNLGLNLKFESKKLKVLGYSRRDDSGWAFSQKAIELIQQYMIKFPEFIAGVQRNPQGKEYADTDFYPAEVATQKMKEIGQWLKSIEAKSFERVTLDADQLDSDVVLRIQHGSDECMASASAKKNELLKGVPRHAILKPADAAHRLGGQRFATGDRVVYVQDSGKIPLGLTGTVVGLTRTARTTLLDLLLDASFISGNTLGDRCSPFRGGTVPSDSVLNLTDRQIFVESKAGAARQPAQAPHSFYANGGYGAPQGPDGQGQFFDAKAPAPLRGSFRGAVGAPRPNGAQASRGASYGGSNGGARGGFAATSTGIGGADALAFRPSGTNAGMRGGRGGLRGGGRPSSNNVAPAVNRKGFTIVDNSDPSQGVVKNNPNFRPQSYANVPPPAMLNAVGAGGRGLGGHGRGGGSGLARAGGSRGGIGIGHRGGPTT